MVVRVWVVATRWRTFFLHPFTESVFCRWFGIVQVAESCEISLKTEESSAYFQNNQQKNISIAFKKIKRITILINATIQRYIKTRTTKDENNFRWTVFNKNNVFVDILKTWRDRAKRFSNLQSAWKTALEKLNSMPDSYGLFISVMKEVCGWRKHLSVW